MKHEILADGIEIYCGDCLEVMQTFEDKSINLVPTDPPYNIGKADWDKIDGYIDWCGLWIEQCQRVLMDNGSFYFFHNDMEQIADLMLWIRENTDFVFKQFIVWNKRFDGANNKFAQLIVKTSNASNFVDVNIVDGAVNGIATIGEKASKGLRRVQTGVTMNYVLAFVIGIILLIVFLVLVGW